MTKLNTYLNFAGNTEEAFNFYKSVFGGEFTSVVRFKDMPMEGVNIPKEDENKIMHIGLPIGKDNVLMATDTLESLGQKLIWGNNIHISVHPESREEADRIFNALSAGGMIEMHIANQPWGDYYGSFKDKFGVQWMVNYIYPKEKRIKMTQKISPCLWFDDNAEEAAKFYTSIFPNSKILEVVPYTVETPSNKPIGSVMAVSFELDDCSFLGLNGGPDFKPNPSISFHIKCKTIEEVDSYYEKLSENGKILMELNEYPFSKKYAWVEDKFGVSWQIIYMEKDFNQKIVPAFLFTQDICGKAREAIKSYVQIFPESKIGVISEYGKNYFNEKENSVMYSEFTLVNEEFIAMDSGSDHKFKFSEGISLMIECKDQKEIDYFYEKLSAVPESEMCGWLKDKFGVSWQLITSDFIKLDKNKKVMEAILKMKRLDLAKLKEAAERK